MKVRKWFEQLAAALACAGILVPGGAIGAERPSSPSRSDALVRDAQPTVADVTLGAKGVLSGSVVNAQGRPMAGVALRVLRQAEPAGEATTDASGNFRIAGLSGGVHEVVAAETSTVYRLWAENSAPPGAAERALFVIDPTVVRGQRPLESLLCVDPLLIGALVATAIAVPVIVHNTRHDRNSGS